MGRKALSGVIGSCIGIDMHSGERMMNERSVSAVEALCKFYVPLLSTVNAIGQEWLWELGLRDVFSLYSRAC